MSATQQPGPSTLVADTDLVIDYLRGRGAGMRLVPGWLRTGQLRLTAVTLFELRSGLDWTQRSQRIEALFLGGPLPLDGRAARRAGAVEAALRARGLRIGFADVLQAGICLAARLPLATNNRRHFERVEGLSLVELPA